MPRYWVVTYRRKEDLSMYSAACLFLFSFLVEQISVFSRRYRTLFLLYAVQTSIGCVSLR